MWITGPKSVKAAQLVQLLESCITLQIILKRTSLLPCRLLERKYLTLLIRFVCFMDDGSSTLVQKRKLEAIFLHFNFVFSPINGYQAFLLH